MKKIVLGLLVSMSSLLAELQWADSYEEALQSAKEKNKIVMLMFSTQTCKMCNYMKDIVYEDVKVMEYVDAFFIPVEIDIEQVPDKKGYQVFGTPTYYFLDADGEQIGRMFVGGAKPDGFVTKLKEVMQEAR